MLQSTTQNTRFKANFEDFFRRAESLRLCLVEEREFTVREIQKHLLLFTIINTGQEGLLIKKRMPLVNQSHKELLNMVHTDNPLGARNQYLNFYKVIQQEIGIWNI